jgi:hypothetical protein
MRRLLDHYVHTAHAADRLLNPARDPITLTAPDPGTAPEQPADHGQALAWFTAEHAMLMAAVDHAATGGFDTHAWQLAWTLTDFLDRRGRWHDLATVGRVALAAAGRRADPTAQARAHRYLAYAYTRLGRFDDAHTQLRHALDLTSRAGNRVGQADIHRTLAQAGNGRTATPRPSTMPCRPSPCTGPQATRADRRRPSTRSAGTTPWSATIRRRSPAASRRSP